MGTRAKSSNAVVVTGGSVSGGDADSGPGVKADVGGGEDTDGTETVTDN